MTKKQARKGLTWFMGVIRLKHNHKRKKGNQMNNIYDYKNNINVITTPNGDKVITMNEAIYVELLNHVWDASKYQESQNHRATAESTLEMRDALDDKMERRGA